MQDDFVWAFGWGYVALTLAAIVIGLPVAYATNHLRLATYLMLARGVSGFLALLFFLARGQFLYPANRMTTLFVLLLYPLVVLLNFIFFGVSLILQ
ncbi:MAG: hypothetical protein M3220_06810 [Chloroflexota bacterium]|nr:hypothetical protein [Chloroflexota bacterium]